VVKKQQIGGNTMSQELTNKAMLVRLSISQWTAKKYDKKVSKEVAEKYGTEQDRGRYNKVLVAKAELERINKAAGAARTFHYQQTLPWSDDGARILPSANYLNYTQQMRELHGEFEKAVATFIDNYPSLVADARWQLNGLFNPDDYPALNRIGRKFSIDVTVDPLPTATDFRVDLNLDEVARIRKDIEARSTAATETAMADLWTRLHDVVSKMAERLGTKDAIFRDSLVDNVAELVDLLPRLNLTGDARLDAMRREVADKLLVYEPETLRKDGGARKETARAAEDILAAMSGYCDVKAA
jgi:hypothetical protein